MREVGYVHVDGGTHVSGILAGDLGLDGGRRVTSGHYLVASDRYITIRDGD